MARSPLLTPGFLPPSGLPGVVFPSFLDSNRVQLFSVLAQLQETQWWSPEQLRAHQLAQLGRVIRHAARTTRYGRAHFPDLAERPLTWERFAELPILERSVLQSRRRALISEAPPKEHGKGTPARTSGSTGTPVVVERTGLPALVWQAIVAREILWHGRDTSQTMAVIRHAPEAAGDGIRAKPWSAGAALIGPPGAVEVLHIDATTEEQLRWLQGRDFAYLHVYPSCLRDLLELARARGVRFPNLRVVTTFSEIVTDELRRDLQDTWGVPLQDVYSSQEMGYLALQCPEHPWYHLQSESAVVELLREDGTPCDVGEAGRVVVTPLHNFAMPLVRCDIQDFAVRGPPCPCGRGLPVLERILGREHQTFVTASGDKVWLTIGVHLLRSLGPVRQHQLVQYRPGQLELRMVPRRPPTPGEEAALLAHLRENVPAGTELSLSWVEEIPRTAVGKHLDFLSLVPR